MTLDPMVLLTLSWCGIALPAIPLVAWARAVHAASGPRTEPALLLLLTAVSYGWLLVGVFVPLAIGPDYSARRNATAVAHLVAMLLLGTWAVAHRGRLGRFAWLAALATAGVWAYLLAISSVV